MDTQLIVILVAVALVIFATFILKRVFSIGLKVAGLAVVAFLGRRTDVGAQGFDWMTVDDLVIIGSAAVFGFIVGIILNAFIFREDGLGRHFINPMIAVAVTYGAALLIQL